MKGALILLLFVAVAACGGRQIPTHSGQKGSKPWLKAKRLVLKKNVAKAEAELDYPRYKRARWFAVDLPYSGMIDVKMDVTPGGPASGGEEDEEEAEMDVGLEILDGSSFVVLTTDDDRATDANELKKQRTVKDLPEGRYLIHVYLKGRLDTADVELEVNFTRGELPHVSDFPHNVAWVDALPSVPPLDDSPEQVVKKRVKRVKRTAKPTVEEPEEDSGGGAIMAEISDIQARGSSGTIITIAGGTSDGLENGLRGSVRGMRKGGSFKLSGCGPSTCRATLRAPVDDVRGSTNVIIQLK